MPPRTKRRRERTRPISEIPSQVSSSEHAHGRWPFLHRIEVGEHRLTGRHGAGLANAHADAGKKQLHKAAYRAAQSRHGAEDGDADDDDVATVQPVCQRQQRENIASAADHPTGRSPVMVTRSIRRTWGQ